MKTISESPNSINLTEVWSAFLLFDEVLLLLKWKDKFSLLPNQQKLCLGTVWNPRESTDPQFVEILPRRLGCTASSLDLLNWFCFKVSFGNLILSLRLCSRVLQVSALTFNSWLFKLTAHIPLEILISKVWGLFLHLSFQRGKTELWQTSLLYWILIFVFFVWKKKNVLWIGFSHFAALSVLCLSLLKRLSSILEGGKKNIAGAQWKQDVNLLLIQVFEGWVFDSISIPLLFWNLISRLD